MEAEVEESAMLRDQGKQREALDKVAGLHITRERARERRKCRTSSAIIAIFFSGESLAKCLLIACQSLANS